MARCAYVTGSLLLIGALLAVGISFFAPFWLANVDIYEQPVNETYFLYPLSAGPISPDGWIYVRGLWAECGVRCQWFWENSYSLQKKLFTPLKWHIASQVLYFVGASFVLLSVIYVNVQMCCRERALVFRALGSILLISFCLQTAAVAVFGGGAWQQYKAMSNIPILKVDWSSMNPGQDVYFDWCFWMAVAGGGLTLFSGLLFLIHDCHLERRRHNSDKN